MNAQYWDCHEETQESEAGIENQILTCTDGDAEVRINKNGVASITTENAEIISDPENNVIEVEAERHLEQMVMPKTRMHDGIEIPDPVILTEVQK